MPSFLHTYFLLLCPEHLYFLTSPLKTSGFRKVQERVFAAGESPSSRYAPPKIEVIIVLIENGFSISVLPYMDIVHLHNLVTIPVQTSIWKSKFYIARRKYGIRSAATFLISITASVAGYPTYANG